LQNKNVRDAAVCTCSARPELATTIRGVTLSSLLIFLPLESEDCCMNSGARIEAKQYYFLAYHYISMQGLRTLNKEAEASIPTKNPNLYTNGTFKIPRKAKKRTLPWDLKAGKLNLLSPPQDEDIQARKKPRIEEPFSAATDENATKISSLDTAVRLLPLHDTAAAAAAAAADHAESDPVMDMHLNAGATRARRRWTTDEDTRLKKAVLVHTHDGEPKKLGYDCRACSRSNENPVSKQVVPNHRSP
jgi:hypothetical protein